MSTRKNIDKLYSEKFRAAEVAPPKDAWQQIASRLPQQKQKKKILPLWFYYAGAAAFMALFFGVDVFLNDSTSETPVVNVPVEELDIHDQIQQASLEFNQTMMEVTRQLRGTLQDGDSSTASSSQEVAASGAENSKSNAGEGIASQGNSRSDNSELNPGDDSVPTSWNPKFQNNNPITVGNSNNSVTSGVASETASDYNQDLVENEVALQTEKGAEFESEISEENAIAQRLESELSEAENIPGQDAAGKLSISTRVAPVFYDNVAGNGDPSVAGSQSSGEVSLSYGINLAYQVSDKLKIRSGLNKLDLSYNTPGVPVAAAMNAPSSNDKAVDPFLHTASEEGDLQQQMDFIEVPFEVEYRLLDRVVDFNLIAGGSTLFLNKNQLSLNSGIRTTQLGEAEDINDVNFSANLGLGVDYQIAPGLHLNLEPMFKYQLNSFSAESGVRPYYMAIYSGFSISF